MGETNREVELRLAIKDSAALEQALRASGARLIGEGLVRTTSYDFPDHRLRASGQALRLREDWTGTTLTSKVPLPANESVRYSEGLRIRDEINVSLPAEEGDSAHQLLLSLGLRETLRYEKRRRSWQLGDARIDVDVLADGGDCYAEIEAGEAEIPTVRARLGLDDAPIETRSYFEIVRQAREERGSR